MNECTAENPSPLSKILERERESRRRAGQGKPEGREEERE